MREGPSGETAETQETQDTNAAQLGSSTPRPEEVTALVIVWSADEPERVGELLIPAPPDAEPLVFGRGPGKAGHPRLEPVRQRPGVNVPCPPLQSAKLSREQLRVRPREPELIELENLGRRKLVVNGRAITRRKQVRDGDIVELHGQLVFLVVRRPVVLPSHTLPPELIPEFGQSDACGTVGESPPVWLLRERIAFAAANEVDVVISGASGTGKELVAQAIHRLSSRSARPLVSRNAATFPPGLIDAELFGNVRNFPNPGMTERPGLFGAADGSTLFLDEIGELPHELQAHLLRVLDLGEYQRLGEAKTRRATVRFIGATNRPLHALKHDLLARLKLKIELPGLGARLEDIALLIPFLVRRAARDSPSLAVFFESGDIDGHPRIDPSFVVSLLRVDYQTHVRELEGLLWTAMMNSVGAGNGWIRAEHTSEPAAPPEQVDPASLTAEDIVAALAQVGGVKDRAWPLLGLNNRYQLLRLLKKHGIGSGSASDGS